MTEQEPSQEPSHFDYESLPDEFKSVADPTRIYYVGMQPIYGAGEGLNIELIDEMRRLDMSHVAEDGTEMGPPEVKALLYCKFLLDEAPDGLQGRIGYSGHDDIEYWVDKKGKVHGEKRAHYEAKIRSVARELEQRGTLQSNHGIEIYYSLLGEGLIRDKSMTPKRVISELACCWEGAILARKISEEE